MTIDELESRLAQQQIIRLPTAGWEELAGHFAELERHDTSVSGSITILAGSGGLIAVEEPTREQRVLRRLATREAAAAFVAARLATYERMWNGCGCKVDYDH